MDAPNRVCPRCGGHFEGSAAFCPKDGTPLSAAADTDAYVGQVLLGQFRVLARVGAGGMGTVYRARQVGVERDVAIKILHPELVQNEDAVRRFQREARVSAALDHPNVVRVFLFGQLPDGNLYIVMEYLEGKSLSDVLRTTGAMPVPRALHITTQICAAIGESHAQGVVHRDVKPENVHLVKRGRDEDFVKVLDFGIARFLWGEQTMVTQTGLIFGTARYISPEGASGEPTDARSDVYSLGVLCYQLLCGETPFDSPSPVALLMKHIHEPALDIRTRAHGTHVPTAIAEVLARALAKSPDARWDDATMLGEALRDAAAASGFTFGVPARRASMPEVHAARMDPTPLRVSLAASPIERARSVMPNDSLARAPSPYGATTGDGLSQVSIAGLPSRHRKRPTFGVVILSFALGACAVAGGAMIAKFITRSEQESAITARHNQLVDRANAALAAEAYDAPPGDNVVELTDQILTGSPHDVTALGIRREAARRLDGDGDRARGDGLVEEAQSNYRRALELVPQDTAAARGLAALETPAERLALSVDPAAPTAGTDVTIVATFAPGVHPESAPTARVLHAGRVVRTLSLSAGDDARTYRATYSPSPAGEYEVEVSALAGGPISARQTFSVAPAQLAVVRHGGGDPQEHDPSGFVPPRNSNPGPIPPASSDGINWDAPPPPGGATVQSAGTVVQDAPPPPWTGNPI